MNINKFEEQIKSLFERHRPELDTDAIWENIEPKLKKKKKRRGFIWFFWGLGLGLLLLLFWAIGKPPVEQPLVGSSSQIPSTELAKSEQERLTASQKSAPGTQQDKSNTPDYRDLVFEKNAPAKVVAPSQPAQHKHAPTFAGTAKKPELQQAENIQNPKPANASENEPEPGNVQAKNTNPETSDQQPLTSATVEPASQEIPVAGADPDPEAAVQENPAAPAGSTPEISEPLEKNRKTVEKAGKGEQASADKNKSKNKKRRSKILRLLFKFDWEQQLSLQTGPELAVRLLSARQGSAAYLAARKSNEKSLEAFSAAMYYAAVSRKGFLVKTGLEYRQINERFHHSYHTKETFQTTGVLTQTVDGSGAVVGQTTGPKTVTTTIDYSNTIYNQYRFVNLPLGIGYQHTDKKSRWELSGGLNFNLLFRAAGAISNEYDQAIYLNAGDSFYGKIFRQKAGLGLWASYGYSRKITDKLRWQASAQIQAPLSAVTAPEYDLVQRYLNFGVQAGVVYQIKAGKKGR